MTETEQPEPSVDHRTQDGGADGPIPNHQSSDLLYTVGESPPWYLCFMLGLQHYLTAFGGILTVPLLLAPHLCMAEDYLAVSQLISTILFVSGICTLLQTTVGSRLPVVHGPGFAFLTPIIAMMSLPEWCCPFNDGNLCDMNATGIPEVGSEDHQILWQARLAEIQGAVMVASVFQIVIGVSGLMGFVLRFIGPLTIAPTITLLGLSLFKDGANQAAELWWIALMTIFFIALFSQYLSNMKLPLPSYTREGGFTFTYSAVFRLFPVLLGICLSWLVCYILTASGALTSDPEGWGYQARTDSRISVLYSAPWFYFPYPGIVAAVGLSNLQFVDLNSSRNLFILGFSIFFGLSLANWMSEHSNSIQTGSEIADQILTVLCSTSMFVGGLLGFVLDNTIPGSDEERGIIKWRTAVETGESSRGDSQEDTTYDLPLVQKFLTRWRWTSYLPFCPTFRGFGACSCNRKKANQNGINCTSPESVNVHAKGNVEETQLQNDQCPACTTTL